MYKVKQKQGITLIALVVTLVILMILAAVSINIILGDQGIFGQAKKSANSYQQSEINDLRALESLASELEDVLATPIPIQTAEQLFKIGTGEKVEVAGNQYYFNKNRTYAIQNNIEYTGSYDAIAELIKNGEVNIQGNGYQIVVTNEEGKKEYYTEASKYYIATNAYGYVLKGLELFFDGKDNAGEGLHDNTATVWKDLSGNNKDGTLHNFGNSAISGWNNEYLSFDGVNDWVSCTEMNYPNVSIEAVYTTKSYTQAERGIVGNWETGGNGIITMNGKYSGNIYKEGQYYQTYSTNLTQTYTICTQTLTYNGKEEILYIDGAEQEKCNTEGNIEYPQNNTIMIIGSNPNKSETTNKFADIDVYAVRIYSRGLTKEEVEINNQADNKRIKNQTTIPVYTAEQLFKLGTGEEVKIEQENKVYTYAINQKYELKNDITVKENYQEIIDKINNKEIEIQLNDKKIIQNEMYYTANGKYTIAVNEQGYVLDALELLLDGKDNEGTGKHNEKPTIWKDLSGNNRDAPLTYTNNIWENNGLTFDGVDDYVPIAEMNYENITLEAVTSTAEVSDLTRYIVGNINTGGYDLYFNGNNLLNFLVYNKENAAYSNCSTRGQIAKEPNVIYSVSGSYDGNVQTLRCSNTYTSYQEKQLPGTIGKTTDNTYMMLGANPIGTKPQSDSTYLKGSIYSIRIYSKALSEEENAVNYLNDRIRYQV